MSQQGVLTSGSVIDFETLTGNTGGPVGPDGAGNINVVGANGIIVSGNPGTNTLTIEPDTGLFPITPFVVGPVGQAGYQTIQDGLDAANAAGGGAVYVQVGTYTEDLTLYANVDLWGVVGIADTGTCKIIGEHTPPSAGNFTIRNIFLESATNIFNSAAAGTGSIILIDCAIDVTNGYTFNCPNWTGGFACFDIGEIGSTNDGWVNNTGGATVFMTNITMGAGSSNTMIASGFVELYNCAVQCPVDFQTGANGIITGGSYIKANMTFSNDSTFEISNCLFSTGANQAITYDSSANSTLSTCTISSSNNPAIGGTGSGTLTIGSLSFTSNADIAGSVTTSFGVIESGTAYLDNISFDEGATLLDGDGEIWIGSGAGNPSPGLITSTGGSITVSVGPNTINIETDGSIAASFPTDSGTATPAAGALTVAGGTLMNTAGAASTVTINADDNVVGSVAGDSGTATPTSNSFTIAGGTGCSTTGAGATLTVDVDAEIPSSFPTDSGTATPAANALTIAGGTNINTSGAGSTVTVNLDTNIDVGTIDCTQVTVDPGASGDSFVQFDINTTGEFRIGVDDTDGDAFKISQGSALGNNDTQVVTADGEVTFPLTPAFLATHTVAQNNVTGTSTNVTINFTTEIFDQNGDYDGTNTFTAPVTGRYMLGGGLRITDAASSTVSQMNIITSNRGLVGIAAVLYSSSQYQLNGFALVDMDAGDTATLVGFTSGMAGDTADFPASATNTYFYGSLQC